MFILDEPYASPVLLRWLEESQHPVLCNSFAQKLCQEGAHLLLLAEDEAALRIEQGERVCTNSENALAWLCKHASTTRLAQAIELCKNKELMRKLLQPLDPQLFFRGVSLEELFDYSYADLPECIVLKPSVGFCSLGVHAVHSETEWVRALRSIEQERKKWADFYPSSVVGASRFIMEEIIEGQEYALDMFYDEQGKPSIFNILQHDFASQNDTSDRFYWCSEQLNERMRDLLLPWLERVGELAGFRDFCIHMELRVDKQGKVHAIEFNPLRFAGLGGTDLSWYACGMLGYDAYLENRQMKPFASDNRYVMSVLMTEGSVPDNARFDFDAFTAHFSRVLELRLFDRRKVGAFGFLFLELPQGSAGDEEADFLLHCDLAQYLC